MPTVLQKIPSKPAHKNDPWWGGDSGLKCGRVTGRISSGGSRWKVSSEGSVWLWLNREGSGLVWGERERFILKPGMYALTGGGNPGQWSCVRYPGQHVLEVVVLSREWLRERLGRGPEWQHPELGKWLEEGGSVAFCGLMGLWENELCDALELAAEDSATSKLLAESKILEWAAVRLFRRSMGDGGGGFCSVMRGKDHVRRAIEVLAARSNQPLDLTALAKQVGVAPHHLSRRVSRETGKTLQRHLRQMRIHRACELLQSRKMNISEVGLEVGYQSLSHFAKAFREETGMAPSEWGAEAK